MTAAGKATAVIAAAGSGDRLGGGAPKALVELAGRPMVAWSLDAFAASAVDSVIIAAPAGHEAELEDLAPKGIRVTVVTGGASRSHSVALALAGVEAGLIAVHDAARPLVSSTLIDELLAALAADEDLAGVIAAAPIIDTVKRAAQPRPHGADGEFTVAATEDRDLLWAAQTPQVFRTAALRDALAADPGVLATATDDAALVERAGGSVLLHPAPAANPKVTTPHDLRLAESLLSDRSR